ncbi:MAG: ferrous iron transport protein B [Bacillota bacterium]|nr:ferrous iron transport protein B [Bacillota bacterium]
MSLRIALAGNPNSGKTTVFNLLTGATQYVGNWPGVTVEKKEGALKNRPDVLLEDLPGIYSLSPYSPEEIVSRDYLLSSAPNMILNIVDASNLERNLYLTTQLAELGLPMLVALNMSDVVHKRGDAIDVAKLSQLLKLPVVEISALHDEGVREAVEQAIHLAENGEWSEPPCVFSGSLEHALAHIEDMLHHIFEDEKHGEDHHHVHRHHSRDGGLAVDIPEQQLRWYALRLFERDPHVCRQMALDEPTQARVEMLISAAEQAEDEDAEALLIRERYDYVERLTAACLVHSGKRKSAELLDRLLVNRWAALPIFALVMFAVYYVSISGLGGLLSDWATDTLFGALIPNAVSSWLAALQVSDWLIALIVDGIIAGVGAVLGFLPQLAILFLCLALLEDCGYMARIAFILDRIFRRFGLSGKSFIPMLIATGCAVPGIMASRTIENDKDRRMTVITASFMPCGAKLPLIGLIAGALFGGSALIAASAYVIGASSVLVSGLMLKKTRRFACSATPFIMELPDYHLPNLRNVLLQAWDRCKAFIKKAGTIILLASMLIWLLSNFNWRLQMSPADASMLASLGNLLAPLFAPLGWGSWQAAVATIAGLTAKEAIVGTMGVLYGVELVSETGMEMWSNFAAAFTPLGAYSFLLFNLLCVPCFAAVGAIRREMDSARWTLTALGYQACFAYGVSLCVYQLGRFLGGHGFNFGSAAAMLIVAIFLYLLLRKQRYQCEFAAACNPQGCAK